MTIPDKLTDELSVLCRFLDDSRNDLQPDLTWCALHKINENFGFCLSRIRKGQNVVDISLFERRRVNGHAFIHFLNDVETDVPISEILPALMKVIERHPEIGNGETNGNAVRKGG